MTDAVPHKFICECGAILINHYPTQIVKHRLSKKHAVKLMKQIEDKEDEKKQKIKEIEKKESMILTFE